MRTWTDEQFIKAFNSSNSISEVTTKLGLKRAGATNHFIKHATRLNLDLESFYVRRKERYIRNLNSNRRRCATHEEVLIEHSPYATREAKKRILDNNLIDYKCFGCSITEWTTSLLKNNPTKLVLDLDHINGDNTDHRLENLRFLCPNCHSLTPTFKAKNLKRKG